MASSNALLGGRYEMGDVIGHGGMAEVRRGRDVRLGRDVAIKLLRPDLARDPSSQGRFRREAQSAAQLNSPGIVAIYDTGEGSINGVTSPYIVMEYVEGRTLKDVLAAEGRLLPRRALEITAAICSALEQAHVAGIVHRDIKPANVMITPTGEVKVMDFGIARALTGSTSTMTQTAAVVGTAHYLSPEQARGEHVDARSDIYSTGCLLYELLTGAPPFTGDTAVAVAYQHVREDPIPPSSIEPDIPEAADTICLVAMAKNPINRYASAGEMREDIERALAGVPLLASPVRRDRPDTAAAVPATTVLLREPPHHRRGVAYALLAVATLAVFVIAFVVARNLLSGSNDSLTTPNVVGQSLADAQSTLGAQGLRIGHVTYVYTDKTNKGEVIQQSPPAGLLYGKGDAVDLTVSNGVQYVFVPGQLVGLANANEAKSALDAAHLKLGRVIYRNSSATAGQVLQTDPQAGTSVPVNSRVNIYVSNSQVKVPKVVGDNVADATAILQQAGFNPVPHRAAQYIKNKDGTVLSQFPSANTYAKTNADVVIYVDEKPSKPTNSPSPSSSPSTSSTPSGPPSNSPSP